MSFEFLKKMPTPAEIKEEFPLPENLVKLKADRDDMIKKVFTGESDNALATFSATFGFSHIISSLMIFISPKKFIF